MLKVITAPTVEPVTVAEVKEQSYIATSADDAMIGRMISAARAEAENITKRSLAPQTLEVVLDVWPGWSIKLPRGPVSAVSSVKYYDEDGVEQTLSASVYESDIDSLVAKVQPKDGEEWPDVDVMANAIRIRYTAGWTAANIPPEIKQWILIRVASFYAQRESFVTMHLMSQMPRSFADSLLDGHKVVEV